MDTSAVNPGILNGVSPFYARFLASPVVVGEQLRDQQWLYLGHVHANKVLFGEVGLTVSV